MVWVIHASNKHGISNTTPAVTRGKAVYQLERRNKYYLLLTGPGSISSLFARSVPFNTGVQERQFHPAGKSSAVGEQMRYP